MKSIWCWLAGLCSAAAIAAGSGEDKQVSLTIYRLPQPTDLGARQTK